MTPALRLVRSSDRSARAFREELQDRETSRPFRLWNETRSHQVRWRYYATPEAAHWGTLRELYLAPAGEVVTVFDCRTMREMGTYQRTPDSVKWLSSSLIRAPKLPAHQKE